MWYGWAALMLERPGQHFAWGEFEVTRSGIANVAPPEARARILALVAEVLDPLRGVYAAGLAYCSPMRWYPDRTLGTVDLPGTAGDPQTDGETAPGWPELDGCEEYGTGDYWPVYLAREPNRRLHQSSGLYRSARLELLYTVEA
jgi:hypothetical protein